jgi:hypothetical protein
VLEMTLAPHEFEKVETKTDKDSLKVIELIVLPSAIEERYTYFKVK